MRRIAEGRASAVLAAALMALALVGCDDEPTVAPDLTPPAAPQALSSVTGDGRVTLNWVRNTELDFYTYRVWRGAEYGGPYDNLGSTATTTYVDETAENGVTYFFAVSAVDRSGNESALSVESVFDTPRPEGFDLNLVNARAYPDGPSGFDFSAAVVRTAINPATDIYYTAVPGGLRFLAAGDPETFMQDAGYHELDRLDWAPDENEGWSPAYEVEAVLGHCYYVWMRDESRYAKVRVTALEEGFTTLDWAYQPVPGNPELTPGILTGERYHVAGVAVARP
jgi:hypothetical protein